MQNFDPSAPLIFIHVPKTAGTSVREVFQNWFAGRLYPNYFDAKARKRPERIAPELLRGSNGPALIYGHFNRRRGFSVEDLYPDVSQFVTILRDPYETAISRYFFVRKIEGFHWQNEQCQADVESYIRQQRSHILDHFPRPVTMENFKDILDEFFVSIGLFEHLETSLVDMARALGKAYHPNSLRRVNRTERHAINDQALKAMFQDLNPLEYAVYNEVVARNAAATK